MGVPNLAPSVSLHDRAGSATWRIAFRVRLRHRAHSFTLIGLGLVSAGCRKVLRKLCAPMAERARSGPIAFQLNLDDLGNAANHQSISKVKHVGLWDWLFGGFSEGSKSASGVRGVKPEVACESADLAVAVAEREDGPADLTEQEEAPWWAPRGATLTDLPEPPRPEMTTEARALENLLVSHFDGHDLTLPPLLHVAETLMPKLADPNCDLAVVANGLSEDQVIAAAVLRMANSPLYRGLNKISALRAAVTRLGTRALRMLLMHESLRAATFFQKRGDNELARSVWRRALASAVVMRELAAMTKTDPDEAFLTGLLHNIGNVIVLRIALGSQPGSRYRIDADTFEYLCHESHQEFGELVAKTWRLPAGLTAIIADHHTYPRVDDALRITRLQVRITDMINALLGYAPYAPINLLESNAVRDLDLCARGNFRTFLERLPEDVAETVRAL